MTLAVFVGTLFYCSPAACILCGKSPENKVGFLVGADRHNGLMTLASGHEPQAQRSRVFQTWNVTAGWH